MGYRYLGNKSRLADWIADILADTLPAGASISDPMCGTASVSEALALRGFSVQASDNLFFPTIHAFARICIKEKPKFETLGGYQACLDYLNSLEAEFGYFYQEFGAEGQPANGRPPRRYFTAENAAKIDSIRGEICKLSAEGAIDQTERMLLLHDLILATNNVANIVGTYGYFRSNFGAAASATLILMPSAFRFTEGFHAVCQGEAKTVLSNVDVDAVYLDPPYTKRQYAGNYHLLETLALGDKPEAQGDGGLRPWKDKASDFCYKRTAERAFLDVLDATSARNIFISYSEDGQVPPDQLRDLLGERGEVRIYEKKHPRYKSNTAARAGEIVERLYHLEVTP